MTTLKRIRNFNQRWNIPDEEPHGVAQFRSRVAYIVEKVLGKYILRTPNLTGQFLYLLGRPNVPKNSTELAIQILEFGTSLKDNEIYKSIVQAANEAELVKAVQYLFWTLEDRIDARNLVKQLVASLREAISLSSHVNISLVQHGDRVMLYPAGAKLLDDIAVNETLAWLEGFPTVAKHFEQALQIYQSKDTTKYRNLLDDLRVALEQLLRKLLNNQKPLEKQSANLSEWLTARGIHPQVVNLYGTLLFGQYRAYQNDAVKHDDKSSPPEVEFMIYLTGTFIRFLLQVAQEPAHGSR